MIILAAEELQDVVQSPEEVAEDVNQFVQWFQDQIPTLISFGIKVILAIVFFLDWKSGDPWNPEDGETLHAAGECRYRSDTVCRIFSEIWALCIAAVYDRNEFWN